MAAVRSIIQTNRIAGGVRVPILVMFSNGYYSSSYDFDAPIPLAYLAPASAAGSGTDTFVQMCQVSKLTPVVYATPGGTHIYEVYPHIAGIGGVVREINLVDETGADDTTYPEPSGVTLCCMYRGRLVVSDGANFYMSRAGYPGNWDYTKDDKAAAIAGNNLSNGALGDIHVALVPQTNDNLVILCSRSMFQIIGDPANGGSIEQISRDVGCFGPDAWTQDDEGNIYFAGPSGFYKMAPGGRPVNLSKKRISTFFDAIDIGSTVMQVRFDGIRKLIYIFNTRIATAAGYHLVYDIRQDAFLKWQFPTTQGPLCSVVYLGSSSDECVLLLGGRDGVMRKLDPDALSDDGTAIESKVFIGPLEPAGPANEAMLIGLDLTMGEAWGTVTGSDVNADVQLQVASDPYTAWQSPEQTKVFTSVTSFGIQDRQAARVAAEWHWLKISNSTLNKTWSIDRAVGHFIRAGSQDGENVT